MKDEHIPQKCEKCFHIKIKDGSVYICIEIMNIYTEFEQLEVMLDTKIQHQILVLSSDKYRYLFTNIECPRPIGLKEIGRGIRKIEIMRTALSDLFHYDEKDIEGGMIGLFRLINDNSIKIDDKTITFEREIIVFGIPNLKNEFIGFAGLKKNLIKSNNKNIDDDLEISILPNKEIGYLCRGVKGEISCILNSKTNP